MIIRGFSADDVNQLIQIHDRFYKDEFSLDEFNRVFLEVFVVEEDKKIISVGGVRTIAESVIVTNKDIIATKRREALTQMLQAQSFICNRFGFNQLHAFVQDKLWEKRLIKTGFKHCKGNALFIEV